MRFSLAFFFDKVSHPNNNYISHLPKPEIRRDLLGTCLKERGEAKLFSSGFIEDVKYNLIGRRKNLHIPLGFFPLKCHSFDLN